MSNILQTWAKINRPEHEICRKSVIIKLAREMRREWDIFEEHEVQKKLEEISKSIGGGVWKDGWIPVYCSIKTFCDKCNYDQTQAVGISVVLKRSETHKQHIHDLLDFCQRLIDENNKLKSSFWYKLKGLFLSKVL
jgi:hypothetical protein